MQDSGDQQTGGRIEIGIKRLTRLCVITGIGVAAFWGFGISSITAFAWGDNDGGRPSYTIEEINNGALGPVGANANKKDAYPGTIVFNNQDDRIHPDVTISALLPAWSIRRGPPNSLSLFQGQSGW